MISKDQDNISLLQNSQEGVEIMLNSVATACLTRGHS